MLTWQSGNVHLYNRSTFEPIRSMKYEGEGWGICHDGELLAMSNGGSSIDFRDPSTFAAVRTVNVTLNSQPVPRLNELECVKDKIYANVWMTDDILEIDAKSGTVTAVLDASGLLTEKERFTADVLNGIAVDPDTGHFWITGKYWPKMFRITWDSSPILISSDQQLASGIVGRPVASNTERITASNLRNL